MNGYMIHGDIREVAHSFECQKVSGNVLPELLEDEGAAREVKRGEAGVRDNLGDDLGGWARDKLDDACRNASLFEDLVDEVVGVGSGR